MIRIPLRPPLRLVFAALAAVLALAGPAKAAGPRIALFPFELAGGSPLQDPTGMMPQGAAALQQGDASPDEQRRLKLVTDELARLMRTAGYDLVDLSPLDKEIAEAQPLFRCNSCETDLAAKAGADLALTGRITRLTSVLLHIDLTAVDVASAKPVRAVSVDINGDTDDMWLRGVRWLFKNRLSEPPLAAPAK